MIITISGMPGSGKSSVAKVLAKKLGYKHVNMGNIRRSIAKKKGMTLEEFNKLGETNKSTDVLIDKEVKRLGKEEKNVILESRTAWFFIPESLKIFIDVSSEVGAKRILKDLKNKNRLKKRNEVRERVTTVAEMKKKNAQRIASDELRYQKYYGFKPYEKKNFDVVIDASNLSIKENVGIILDYLKKSYPDTRIKVKS